MDTFSIDVVNVVGAPVEAFGTFEEWPCVKDLKAPSDLLQGGRILRSSRVAVSSGNPNQNIDLPAKPLF